MKQKTVRKIKRKLLRPSSLVVVVLAVLISVSYILDKTGVWDRALESVGVSKASVVEGTGVDDNSVLTVYFIDVGQGDCTLFVTGEYSMLIDCGEAQYSGTVINQIQNLGIQTLTYIVATHAHSDHIGGMADIISEIGSEHIIISEPSDSSSETNTYENFLDAVQSSGSEIILAQPEYTFSVGEMICEILAPFNVSSSEENNNSIVMYTVFGETSFLVTGDAEKQVENEVIQAYPDLSVNILRVGHHGSKTSTSEEFLSSLSPETAIISVGAGNSYGHPADETLDLLSEYNVKCYRTDTSGTITVTCDGMGYTVA
ncbi:MAG: MBL fold metallo-hydrolase [Clostridiales bacterium]|nr:MBL fold metallo-hydrolase [Clostridiales bacterium]